MVELDYAGVKRYWREANPSILGPYMMDGFGFPAGAGRFRFRAETQLVRRLIRDVSRRGKVLELGSGIGYWTEHFARNFAGVVAVEGSRPLYEALRRRCAPYANVKAIHGDVLSFKPEGSYALVFLGGMLMYLNEDDVIALLRRVAPLLETGGMILCRETTVREGIVTRQGKYQAVYRSVPIYRKIFAECGLSVAQVEMNEPYVVIQMGCEIVQKWKAFVPERLQILHVVGGAAYLGLRLSYPWIWRVPRSLGLAFPELTNHFFVLQAGSRKPAENHDDSIPS